MSVDRTEQGFQNHQVKVKSCSTTFSLFSHRDILHFERAFFPNRCGSNYCKRCRSSNLKNLRQLLFETLKKDKWRLATLTFAQEGVDKISLLRSCTKNFDRFMKRVKRIYPKVKYARSLELHKSGFPHIHLIVNQYVPQSFLQYHWKETGGGIVDIRATPVCSEHNHKNCKVCFPSRRKMNYKDAARYLTEEFEKKYQDPYSTGLTFWLAGKRTIQLSKSLKLAKPNSEWRYEKPIGHIKDVMEYCYYFFRDYPMSDSAGGLFIGDTFSPNTETAFDPTQKLTNYINHTSSESSSCLNKQN
jgi:hypothetical protein